MIWCKIVPSVDRIARIHRISPCAALPAGQELCRGRPGGRPEGMPAGLWQIRAG